MSVTATDTSAKREADRSNREAEKKAKREAENLKKQQQREAAKAASREKANKELVRRCEEFGGVMPEGVKQDEYGNIANTLDNCYRILESQPWGFGYDELAQSHVFRGKVVWPEHYGTELNDALALAIRLSMLAVWQVEFSTLQVTDSLSALCRANPYNPVTEYLNSLSWDGTARVHKWLHTYLGAPKDEYTSAVGAVFLIGAVARARNPGCKFDTMMILEGEQGAGKSTALKIMGGDWYSDAELGNLKDKDSAMVLRGIWIYEMPELSTMSRTERNTMKAFVTREVDRYRPTRGNLPINQPRRCVFAGTVNPEGHGYLTDTTGNRRYLPVETGKIKLAHLAKDRDQLWAEAAEMFATGYSTVMPSGLWKKAAEVTAAREQADPWFEPVADWVEQYQNRGRVTTNEVLRECLDIEDGVQTNQHGIRLGPIMRALGCAKEKFKKNGKSLNGWALPKPKAKVTAA